jgi:hypothetical protein
VGGPAVRLASVVAWEVVVVAAGEAAADIVVVDIVAGYMDLATDIAVVVVQSTQLGRCRTAAAAAAAAAAVEVEHIHIRIPDMEFADSARTLANSPLATDIGTDCRLAEVAVAVDVDTAAHIAADRTRLASDSAHCLTTAVPISASTLAKSSESRGENTAPARPSALDPRCNPLQPSH